MNAKDRDFFERHWIQWVAANPPPKKWQGTIKEWAKLEMPCIGLVGRLFYIISMKFPK